MKPSSSSKIPKKISDEDRSKKKKIKSKSSKRRHSRRDSSTSSYSSDSDSEEISRSRRKSSKSKKLVDKRKGGLKKSFKKSLRKKKRSRRDSSVSESSSGCSTCSDSDRLRSPVRKSKVRKKESVRGRKRSHCCQSSQVTARNRSPSYPTYSGGSRSSTSSSGRNWSPEERFERKRKRSAPIKGRVESSCVRSPVEERLGSSRGLSPIDERFERRRGVSPIDEDRFESSRGWSPIEGRFGSSHKKWSPIEDRFGFGRGHSPIVERFESGGRQSPIYDRFETGHRWSPIEQRFESHGQNPTDGRFESFHGRSPTEDRDWEHGGTKRLRSVLVVTNSAGEDGNVIMAYDDYPSSRSNEFCGEGNTKRDLNAEGKEKDPCDAQFRKEVISSNDRLEDEGSEAADLELILRHKALENFKKFRGIRRAKLETVNKKGEISEPESYQCSKNFANMLEYKHDSSIDEQRYVQGETDSNNLKGRSISNISTDKVDEKSVRILSNAQNTSSRLKRVQESSNRISSEQTSLGNNNQSRGVCARPSSVKVNGTEVDTADNPASGACNTENQNLKSADNPASGACNTENQNLKPADKPASGACNTENQNLKSDEPMVESASGSQFEQKSFSRMRDGEMVQVSYKVYIPKKTPALERRKLQR